MKETISKKRSRSDSQISIDSETSKFRPLHPPRRRFDKNFIRLMIIISGPGSGNMNKSLPRPSMNILSTQSGQTSQPSYSSMQQQQQQQQTPGSIVMVRPGASANSMGLKRKLDDD